MTPSRPKLLSPSTAPESGHTTRLKLTILEQMNRGQEGPFDNWRYVRHSWLVGDDAPNEEGGSLILKRGWKELEGVVANI